MSFMLARPSMDDQPPTRRCRWFGHHWTKAPIDYRTGRPFAGAWVGGGNAWVYCARCLTPKRAGLKGKTVDAFGLAGNAGKIHYGDEANLGPARGVVRPMSRRRRPPASGEIQQTEEG